MDEVELAVDLPSRRAGARRGRWGRTRPRRASAVCDLGRLRRDGLPRVRALQHRAARRSCAPTAPGSLGPNCLGLAVPRGACLNATFDAPPPASRRAASASRRRAERSAWRCSRRQPSLARLGLSASFRSGTRPTSRRTTCSSGGRTTTRPSLVAALPRVVRQPARSSPGSPRRVARTQADPRDEERRARRRAARAAELAHGRARRLRRRGRRPLPRRRASFALDTLEELIDVAALLSHPAAAARASRRGAHERRRARDPLRRRLRGRRPRASRRSATRRGRNSARSFPPRRASPTRWTCSAPPRR